MRLAEYQYELPAELIAQYPLADRSSSRLLVLDRKTGAIDHRRFSELGGYFEPGDVLVVNETKVFKARLFGRKESGGRIEILLVRETADGLWEALVDKSRRIKEGSVVTFDKDNHLTVVAKDRTRIRVRFNRPARGVIAQYGVVPLPHYIRRLADDRDLSTYQTVYAKTEGSIAAPTAGLHFTPEILAAIKRKGAQICGLTLHVGPGTFKPIRAETVEAHRMDPEFYELDEAAARAIDRANRVFAVGTTATRTLEYAARTADSKTVPGPAALNPGSGWADIFIYPGFEFRVVDKLITNFHLPGSTPLLLVCALAGKDLIFKAYAEAIREKYRFYSYGDAMLIL